jgi:fumarylacetoacetase
MLELSLGGKEPIQLSTGEQRTFLEDGDSVAFRAYCERQGFRRIGFGECRAEVLAALPSVLA